jgi:PEP-CTERM motif
MNILRAVAVAATAILLAGVGVGRAGAATVFDVSFAGAAYGPISDISVTDALFTTTDEGSGIYLITGVTGTATYGGDNYSISLVSPATLYYPPSYNYPPTGQFSRYIDADGFSLLLGGSGPNNGGEVELWTPINYCGEGQAANPNYCYTTVAYALATDNGGPFDALSSLSVSAAPEPATWALLMVGVGAVGAALRWRGMRTAQLPA